MSEVTNGTRDPRDAKAWFYLDNRSDIEAWAALRSDARQLLDRHLVELEARVEEVAEELGLEVVERHLESGSWPRIGLRRAGWQRDGLAEVGVVVEWERAKLLTPGSNQWPYVAVRMLSDRDDSGYHKACADAVKPVRGQLGGQTARGFAFWKYVKIESPVEPSALVETCLTRLRELWDAAAPELDRIYTP